MKTIEIDLFDTKSVDKAITELKDIRQEWQRKTKLCSEMIAAAIADEIQKNMDAIPYTDDVINVKTHQPEPRRSALSAYSTGNRVHIGGQEVVFVEFGAGIAHNEAAHNGLAQRVGFETAIGSYGKGQGNKPYWFIAHNLISKGTPMYAPIVHAIEVIEPQIPTMVRQVFV